MTKKNSLDDRIQNDLIGGLILGNSFTTGQANCTNLLGENRRNSEDNHASIHQIIKWEKPRKEAALALIGS